MGLAQPNRSWINRIQRPGRGVEHPAMNTRWVLPFAVLLAGAQASLANPWEDPDYLECGERQSTADIVECLGELHDLWDGRLNAAYREAMDFLEPSRRSELQAVQRAWIAYRDANFGFYRGGEGTIAAIDGVSCMFAMTRERSIELEELLRY
jgi:uncharacterized protein YecT (DUF1311 family)